jgi:putative glutamine amidotransferase
VTKARPLIGLSTYREQCRWGVWDVRADVLPSDYASSIEAAGGIPVLLPPVDDPAAAASVLRRLDGLVVCGGADVDPERYGQAAHEQTSGWRPDRDTWELALLEAAAERMLPTLGVCRGMQLMAVHAGGALEQHLPDRVGHSRHSPGGAEYGSVLVRTVAESTVQRLVGDDFLARCHHHQAVASHPGYEVAARAADGTVEAMETVDRPFWLAVQWHPETEHDRGLFRGLVAAAALAGS